MNDNLEELRKELNLLRLTTSRLQSENRVLLDRVNRLESQRVTEEEPAIKVGDRINILKPSCPGRNRAVTPQDGIATVTRVAGDWIYFTCDSGVKTKRYPVTASDAATIVNDGASNHGREGSRSYLQRSRKPNKQPNKQRRSQWNNPSRFKGAEEKMMGNVFQVDGEHGKKPNQFEKTRKATLQYVMGNFKSPQLFECIVKDFKKTDLEEPSIPTSESKFLIIKYELDMKKHYDDKKDLDDGLFRLWALLNGQGSNLVKTEVKSMNGYDEALSTKNCLWLLRAYRTVTTTVYKAKHFASTIIQARKDLYSCIQQPDQSLIDYAETLEALYKATIEIDPDICVSMTSSLADSIKTMYESSTTLDPDYDKAEDLTKFMKWTDHQIMAMLFVTNADKNRYNEVQQELENDFLKKTNNYPYTLTEAFALLLNHKKSKKGPPVEDEGIGMYQRPVEDDGIGMYQRQIKPTPGIDNELHPNIQCNKCKLYGHYANKCPGVAETNLFQMGVCFNQVSVESRLKKVCSVPRKDLKNLILLDCASTVHFFMNKSLLDDVTESNHPLYLGTNNGVCLTTEKGIYDDLEVWFNHRGLANVLSYALLTDVGRVVSDSAHHSSIFYLSNVKGWMEFKKLGCGLYAFDIKHHKNNKPNFIDYSLVQTVTAKKSMYSPQQVKRAEGVRLLYVKVNRPGVQHYREILDNNVILNCPYTSKDDIIANDIFGKDLGAVRGRELRNSPQSVPSIPTIQVPDQLKTLHNNVRLFVDIFFVNGIPFLHTISENIGLRTSEVLADRYADSILDHMHNAIDIYHRNNFDVRLIDADLEFASIQHQLIIDDVAIPFNVIDVDTKNHPAERSIRTLKERVRCVIQSLPFECVPKAIIVGAVNESTSKINRFPKKKGISNTLSPLTIVDNAAKLDFNLLQLCFGEYVEVYEDNNFQTNSPDTRGTPAITLQPTYNSTGSYYFLSLVTGKVLNQGHWTQLPMPNWVITRVNDMGAAEGRRVTKVIDFRPFSDDLPPLPEPDNDDDNDDDFMPDLDHNPDDDGISNWHDSSTDLDQRSDDSDADLICPGSTAVGTVEGAADKLSDCEMDSDSDNEPDRDSDFVPDSDTDNDPVPDPVSPPVPVPVGIITHDTMSPPPVDQRSDANKNFTPAISNDDISANDGNSDEDISDNETEEIDMPLADRMYAPRRSARLAGRNPPSNLNLLSIDDDSLLSIDDDSSTANDDPLDIFFSAAYIPDTEQPNACSITLSSFQEEYAGGICLFQDMMKDNGKSVDVDVYNILSTKHSLRETVERFNITDEPGELQHHLTGILLNQMSSKAGIKKHGCKAKEALFTEFLQLYDMNVFHPVHRSDLTAEQIKNTLRALSVIKEKRNNILKGRTVANGKTQRPYYKKSETASHTPHTDSFMLTTAIEAYERRHVGTGDVQGAFLHAKEKDFTVIKFVNEQVEIICKIDPHFKKYVVNEGKNKVIYLMLNQALYGTLTAALFWYELLTETLLQNGFKLNPYDFCVANSKINGKQCTILYHVDDTKISHAEYETVTKVYDMLENHFGPMKIKRGKEHEFIGMKIKYRDDGRFSLGMKPYLEATIEEFGEEPICAATPARSDLFVVDDTSPLVDEKKQKLFHRLVYRTIFCTGRGRKDLETAISFLSKCPNFCNEDDYCKLRRMVHYMHATKDLEAVIGIEEIGKLTTFIDASYAVHPNMRSHTGAAISFGIGVFGSESKMQKLNTKSSTEAELVAVSDVLPKVLFIQLFLEAQGYPIKENIIYQDNKSAMKLEMNGRKSCGKRTRHVEIRYFYIKDLVEKGKIKIKHCPTEKMVADFFTKPLQGSLFRYLRDFILGHRPISELKLESGASKERVGN